MGGGDVADRRLDPRQRRVAIVLAQLAPGEADVLAVPELAGPAEHVCGDIVHRRGV
jgi:hypothetical protein